MSNCQIHVGDIGTVLVVTILEDGSAVDISSASSLQIILRKPDGVSYTKTATIYTDGTDGKLSYTVLDGDLDAAGLWKIQAVVVIPSGTYSSSVGSFKVHCNL